MRHITIFGNNLESLNCLGIPDYVIKKDRSILLDPVSSQPTWGDQADS